MTIFVPNPNLSTTNTGMPGASPVPGGQMNGNPNPNAGIDLRTYPNAPQNAVQQLTGTQQSDGHIPNNAQPNNVGVAAGLDSLLAQMSRGQVILGDSTYGQGGFIAPNAGSSPQNVQPGQNISQPVTARVASTLTYPTSAPYTGN